MWIVKMIDPQDQIFNRHVDSTLFIHAEKSAPNRAEQAFLAFSRWVRAVFMKVNKISRWSRADISVLALKQRETVHLYSLYSVFSAKMSSFPTVHVYSLQIFAHFRADFGAEKWKNTLKTLRIGKIRWNSANTLMRRYVWN